MRIKSAICWAWAPLRASAWRLPLSSTHKQTLTSAGAQQRECQVLCLRGKRAGFSREQRGCKREERFSLGCAEAGSYELERADSGPLFPSLHVVNFRWKLALAGIFTSWKLVNTTKCGFPPPTPPAQNWMWTMYQHTTRRGQKTCDTPLLWVVSGYKMHHSVSLWEEPEIDVWVHICNNKDDNDNPLSMSGYRASLYQALPMHNLNLYSNHFMKKELSLPLFYIWGNWGSVQIIV